MTTIKYQPTTLSSFGAPGTLLSGASESISKATSGAKDLVEDYRRGLETEQERRNKLLISDLAALQSQEDYSGVAGQLSNPEYLKQRYGLEDPSKAIQAVQQRKFDIRDLEDREAEYQQAIRNRQEGPIVNPLINSFGALRYDELRNIDVNNLEGFGGLSPQGQKKVIAGFNKALQDAGQRATTDLGIQKSRFEFEGLERDRDKAQYANSVINAAMVNKDGSVNKYTPEIEEKVSAQLRSKGIDPEPYTKSFRETEKWKSDLNKEETEWVNGILSMFPNETLFKVPFIGAPVGDSDQSSASGDLAKLMDRGVDRKTIEMLFRASREDGVDYNPRRIKLFLDYWDSNKDAKDAATGLAKALEDPEESKPKENIPVRDSSIGRRFYRN